jgi:putative RecB family exonuclease
VFDPPEYLSPSSIGTFRACPQKYKLSRIDRIPEPPTWPTRLGTFVHEVLEKLYQCDAPERTIDTLKTLAADAWTRDDWDAQVSALADAKGSPRDFKVEAFRCMTNLWKLENPEEVELDGMEHEILTDVDGVAMKGYIDRFILADDGTVIISDYKTGNIPNPQYNTDDDKFFQLLAYALMLESSDQETTSKVQLLYLKHPVVHEMQTTPVTLSVARGTIVETKEALDASCASGKFHANTSKLCDWCFYKRSGHCPAFA